MKTKSSQARKSSHASCSRYTALIVVFIALLTQPLLHAFNIIDNVPIVLSSTSNPVQVYADYFSTSPDTTTLTIVNTGTDTLSNLMLSGSGYQGNVTSSTDSINLPDILGGSYYSYTFTTSGTGVLVFDFDDQFGATAGIQVGNAEYTLTSTYQSNALSNTFSPHTNTAMQFIPFLGTDFDGMSEYDQTVPVTLVSGSSTGVPIVRNVSAYNFSTTTSTVSGTVIPNDTTANYFIESGTTPSYGTSTTPQIVGTFNVSGNLSGLSPHTTYYYRLAAVNSSGTGYSMDSQFITSDTSPVATDDTYYFPNKTAQTLNVLANDHDPDGDTLHITMVSNPTGGSVSIVSGSTALLYTPSSRFSGVDDFTYSVSDGFGGFSMATVHIRNPFPNFAGMFQTLLTTGNPTRDGYVTLALGRLGSFTGSFMTSTGTYSFKGNLNNIGHAMVTGSNKTGATVTVMLDLDVSGGSFQVAVNDGIGTSTAHFSPKLVYSKTNPAPQFGTYTLLLPASLSGTSYPQGTGYATMSVASTGAIKIMGKLGDGTSFSAGTWVDANYYYYYYNAYPYASAEQSFPVYASIYKAPAGRIYGTFTFRNLTNQSDLDGTIYWDKPAQSTKQLFQNGFSTYSYAIGSAYNQPSSGEFVLNLHYPTNNAFISFFGGNLLGSVFNTLTIQPEPANTVTPALSSNSLVMKIDSKKAMFSGSFVPGVGKALKFSGLLFQKQNSGAGFFTGPTQTGVASLSAVP